MIEKRVMIRKVEDLRAEDVWVYDRRFGKQRIKAFLAVIGTEVDYILPDGRRIQDGFRCEVISSSTHPESIGKQWCFSSDFLRRSPIEVIREQE